MPNVLVETRGGWLGAKRTAFLAAIQAATVEALRIPPHSLVLRLVEYPMECFVIPHETHETAEQYTHIVIAMFAGRSLSSKRALYQRSFAPRAIRRSARRCEDHSARGPARKCRHAGRQGRGRSRAQL